MNAKVWHEAAGSDLDRIARPSDRPYHQMRHLREGENLFEFNEMPASAGMTPVDTDGTRVDPESSELAITTDGRFS